jgi:hypothetical protein
MGVAMSPIVCTERCAYCAEQKCRNGRKTREAAQMPPRGRGHADPYKNPHEAPSRHKAKPTISYPLPKGGYTSPAPHRQVQLGDRNTQPLPAGQNPLSRGPGEPVQPNMYSEMRISTFCEFMSTSTVTAVSVLLVADHVQQVPKQPISY